LGYLETELFMAVLLTTHKALQGIQKLSFCYLCSRELSSQEAINRDHVPPSSLFAFADRDLPLILPTHAACNFSQSQDDQVIGQLVGLLHGRSPNPKHNKLNISLVQLEGGSPTASPVLVVRLRPPDSAAAFSDTPRSGLPHPPTSSIATDSRITVQPSAISFARLQE
jgi:hypothetical protein